MTLSAEDQVQILKGTLLASVRRSREMLRHPMVRVNAVSVACYKAEIEAKLNILRFLFDGSFLRRRYRNALSGAGDLRGGPWRMKGAPNGAASLNSAPAPIDFRAA